MTAREKLQRKHDSQYRLIYSMIVAGKSANFADKATRKLLVECGRLAGLNPAKSLPFEIMRRLKPKELWHALRDARTGNYTKLYKGILSIINTVINLETCTPSELEEHHGIGPKTSRFFIIWIRPTERYAALDVHILRWLRSRGHDAPKATPSGAKYERLEKIFIEEANKLGRSPRQLDMEIWEAGAKRTQLGTLKADK